MEGFDLIALHDVDKAIMHGGDCVVISKFDYYRE